MEIWSAVGCIIATIVASTTELAIADLAVGARRWTIRTPTAQARIRWTTRRTTDHVATVTVATVVVAALVPVVAVVAKVDMVMLS